MAFRRVITVLAMGTSLMGLASTTFVWASPGQSPVRQTLPTRTWVTLAPALARQTLPASGSRLSFPAGLMAAGVLFTFSGWTARRRSDQL